VHPLAGVLSAYGMGLADQTAMREPRSSALTRGLRADLARARRAGRQARGELHRQQVAAGASR
jgi:5-oxoprolinase (ATP-hydrolysing)